MFCNNVLLPESSSLFIAFYSTTQDFVNATEYYMF